MDASDYVRVAVEELEAACTAAQGSVGFAETASAVRSHMRSATVCLTRCAVVSARSRREAVGQLHFDWEGVPRSHAPSGVSKA